ncbi:hypothetical protein D3C79_520500 [compost metagenome]
MFDFANAGIGGRGAWVAGQDFNRLGGIDWAAATEGNQIVTLLLFERLPALLHQFFSRVGKHLIEHGIRQRMLLHSVK